MSSQAKLDLRPPPNVDFIEGFPGIPSGPGRPQPSVRGEIELRVGQGPALKAKLLTIELRKVETLPGGGPANTYIEPVGSGPVTVWQARNEWELQQTRNYPFQIRIPEAIPPSTALEKGGGIRYELVAVLSLRGKKGLLRKESVTNIVQTAPIVIDKHELHCTWPIYCQPFIRDASADGLTLIIERTYGCYAPGDRVTVQALVKSNNPTPVAVRAYEFVLRETMIFRPGAPQGGGANKKAPQGPQVRTTFIGEQKLPVNVLLSNGTQHSAQLGCVIPPTHAVTTVQWAKHIEVNYNIGVRIIYDNGRQLMLDNIQVMMSSWPRHISSEAIRRIGPAPNVSGPAIVAAAAANRGTPELPPTQVQQFLQQFPQFQSQIVPQARQPRPFTISEKVSQRTISTYGSLPATGTSLPNPSEFGQIERPVQPATASGKLQHSDSITATAGILVASPVNEVNGLTYSDDKSKPTTKNGRNRGSSGTAPPPNRFTIVNMDDNDTENISPASTSKHTNGYMTAEEEKRRLQESMSPKPHASTLAPIPAPAPTAADIENAKKMAEVKKALEEVQEPAIKQPSRERSSSNLTASGSTATKPKKQATWLSAEEEKRRMTEQRRLYDEALEKARVTQERAMAESPEPPMERSETVSPPPVASGSANQAQQKKPKQAWISAEEEKRRLQEQRRLYDQAVENVKKTQDRSASESTSDRSTSPPIATATPPIESAPRGGSAFATPSYLEEKRRFEEAQAAVARRQASSPAIYGQPSTPSPAQVVANQHVKTHSTKSSLERAAITASAASRASTYYEPPVPSQSMSAGAALYQHAVASMKNRSAVTSISSSSPPPTAPTPPPPSAPPREPTPSYSSAPAPAQKQWLSAEEEKAQMRYNEAKRAVERRQGTATSSDYGATSGAYQQPISQLPRGQQFSRSSSTYTSSNSNYQSPPTSSLYRSATASSPSSDYTQPPVSSPPPATPPSISIDPNLSDKDRMNYYYRMQDVAASSLHNQVGSPSTIPSSSPPGYDDDPYQPPPIPPMNGNGSARPLNAMEEKAMLRAQYAAEDAQRQQSPAPPPEPVQSAPPPVPIRSTTSESAHSLIPSRPTLDTRDSSKSSSPGITSPVTDEPLLRDPSISWGKKKATLPRTPTPPPLMPRPPVEYIEETQVQDAMMVSREGGEVDEVEDDDNWPDEGISPASIPLDIQPFTPFVVSFATRPFEVPPPLPPKVPLDA